jgi:hypothetical protein
MIRLLASAVSAALIAAGVAAMRAQERPEGNGFSFRTGVELINVTATVTDENGRFVSSLTAEEFAI